MWTWLKFVTKSPMEISSPNRRKDRLELVVITKIIKGLDDLKENTPYKVPDRFPSDEKPFPGYWVKMAVFWLQARLCQTKWFSPMQIGLPQIHKDPQWALDNAYSKWGESLWPRPKLPPALYDSPDLKSLDLGILAVEGPYAGYLEKVKNQEAVYQWNLLKLGDYQTHPGLYRLGVRVEFQVGSQLIPWGSDSKPFFPLRAVKIELKGSSLFSLDNLKDPTRLAVRLQDGSDPVSQFLQKQFSNTNQRLLSEYNDVTPPSEKLQAALIQELNRLLQGGSLYEEKDFAKGLAQVTLRKETHELIKQNPEGEDLIRLNRFLLEDAYPQEILPSSVEPGGKHWDLAKKIALCALTNHTSIIRHWSWIHLIPATQLAFATRTKLGPDHPLRRLLWPHIYGTVQATKFGSMAQMAKGGDFANVFSFPQKEMCKLFDESYDEFRLYRSVPELDLKARGIGIKGGKVEFSMPTHDNLQELFTVIHDHIKRYLRIFYDDQTIRGDPELREWLNELNTMPGGILEVLDNEVLEEKIKTKKGPPREADVPPDKVTLDNVARLVASFKYLGSVQHEMMGSLLWNYQLWTHSQPTRVYKNGDREPLDVYQRLVNYNFMLMVKRASLMDESIYRRMTKGLPKEEKGKLEKWYGQFVAELEELQSTMDAKPWEAWRIYPKELEAHINA